MVHDMGDARVGCMRWVHESRGARDGCKSTSDAQEVHDIGGARVVHEYTVHLDSTFGVCTWIARSECALG